MAKPKPNDAEPVSLFPFLSILACLIGVLTFIITGVAVSQMDQSEDLANVERAEKYGPLIQQIAADKEELDKLESTRNIQQKLNEQIQQEQAKIDRAKKRILQQQNREQTRKEAQAIQQQLTQANNQIKNIMPQITELRTKIEEDKVELQKRVEAGKPAGTVVRPSGSGVNLKPHFVECTHTHLIMYVGGKQIKVSYGKFGQDKNFIELVDRVAKQDQERIVFLLRPDGVRSFNSAANIARQRQCRYGKIPVPGEGPLDLSMFKKN